MFSAEINVPGAQISVRLAYYENTGTAVALLGWTQLTAVPSPHLPPVDTWRGEYYNNVSLAGAPNSPGCSKSYKHGEPVIRKF